MKQLRIYLASLALIAVVSEGHADDRQDVLDAMATLNAGWKSVDYAVIKAGLSEDFNFFHVYGNLLEEPNWDGLKQWLDTGPKINIQPFHQDVRINGSTAIYTAYERVSINNPDGESVNETRRITGVYFKQKGRWIMVHWHGSLLTPVNPE